MLHLLLIVVMVSVIGAPDIIYKVSCDYLVIEITMCTR